MGMSLHIVGFKPVDQRFLKMKKVYDACTEAGLPIPEEVSLFFNDEQPDASGVKMDMGHLQGVKKYNEEMSEGFEVDLRGIPEDIKVIRFYYSC